MIPDEIRKFTEYFSQLPLFGPRQATRLAFYLLGLDKASVKNLSSALGNLANLDVCERCFFIKVAGEQYCGICSDPKRNPKNIAVVEKETDLLTLEKMNKWNGHYLVLGKLAERGILGQNQKARLEKLKERITSELGGSADEIVIALNATSIGDFTADLIREEFKTLSKKITRLSRGLPTGGEVEFADETTLLHSFEKRS